MPFRSVSLTMSTRIEARTYHIVQTNRTYFCFGSSLKDGQVDVMMSRFEGQGSILILSHLLFHKISKLQLFYRLYYCKVRPHTFNYFCLYKPESRKNIAINMCSRLRADKDLEREAHTTWRICIKQQAVEMTEIHRTDNRLREANNSTGSISSGTYLEVSMNTVQVGAPWIFTTKKDSSHLIVRRIIQQNILTKIAVLNVTLQRRKEAYNSLCCRQS